MKILFVNNKDSFVWNLVEYVSIFEPDTIVVPNTITLEEVREIDPDGIMISPGPGNPNDPRDIGSCIEIIRACEVPLLGVCLGCQAINVAFGGTVGHASVGPVHGKASEIYHDGVGIYDGIPSTHRLVRFTGRRLRFIMTGSGYTMAFQIRLQAAGTIRLLWIGCRLISRLWHTVQTVSLWESGTSGVRSRACSSIPSLC